MQNEKKMIRIRGARENNLKNIDLDIPRDELIVMTGLSGSGKSSLAFDTIYAEGQRRYMESLSSYARQFLGQMEKPKVQSLSGLPPAISIDQKGTNRNPRSTVGTVTEIYDYLRLLYARIGIVHCPKCGKEIKKQTIDEILDVILKLPAGTKLQILAPVVRSKKGRHEKVLESAKKAGYLRARVDGSRYDLSEEILLDKNRKHDIEIIVDRIVMKDEIRTRLADSLEQAMRLSDGLVLIDNVSEEKETLFSQNFACPDCEIYIDEIEPRSFSFNNPFGACPECLGIGYKMEFDPERIIPDRTLSINEGCIAVTGWQSVMKPGSFANSILAALAETFEFDLDTPFGEYPKSVQELLLYGTNIPVPVHYKSRRGHGVYQITFEGIVKNTEQRYQETFSESQKEEYEKYMRFSPCAVCKGKRLRETSLSVTVKGYNIYDFADRSVREMLKIISEYRLSDTEKIIAEEILKEVKSRLHFLADVGLDYLTLMRQASTLSGGESQRIRLATQIGSGLVGVAYILDEPSIGLHEKDNDRLIRTLKNLRDTGNTVIVVEHDENTIREADYVVDIGPGAGALGGEVVYSGTVPGLLKCKASLTGQYLSGKRKIEVPAIRRVPSGFLHVTDATEHNLKHVDVDIPLGVLTVVTGVSGSGKSSLIDEVVTKTLQRDLNRAICTPGACKEITGTSQLDKVISIDQSPIGRTPRSNPATYVGVFDLIRDLFAQTEDARMRGYEKGRFSFNVKGGRCEACSGDGIKKIQMHFLPDVFVPCEICGGTRYNKETLEVLYKGKNISEVLQMTVQEAEEFFRPVKKIHDKIQTMYDVGLSYVKLGQPSTELSGGESQRVKLSTELSKRATGRTIYVLDEPTTGLHFEDVRKLIEILKRLVETGNTVLVIEHNMDVIKSADYLIDMGPDGGDKGGQVVATGTPEELAEVKESYTGQYLKRILEKK